MLSMRLRYCSSLILIAEIGVYSAVEQHDFVEGID